MTATATASMASATGHSMAGMNMGGSCKISMLWNWNTVGACMFPFWSLSSFYSSLTKERKERVEPLFFLVFML